MTGAAYTARQRPAGPPVNRSRDPAAAPRTPASRAQSDYARNVGNIAVSRLPAGAFRAQARLKIGQPDDRYEREADRVADQVMRTPVSPQAPDDSGVTDLKAQRKCAACEGEEETPLQRKPDAGGVAASMPGSPVAGPGRPLDAGSRDFFETRFGRDFGRVRVHDDAQAARSARSLNALAYTVGSDIVFAAGQYAPATGAGRRLLAHELTHTIQQGGSAAALQRACNPAVIAGRTSPVYFPLESTILDVYRGVSTLSASTTPGTAVGLVQQALVDLGHNLGTGGPNGDGVTRIYGADTTAAISAFQAAEGITGATAGVLDQATLKCLDESRVSLAVPSHLTGSVFPTQVRIDSPATGGRDEDIFFDRGSFTLDAAARARIGRLLTRSANPLRGCNLTLEGFISEDERVEFGAGLARRRIDAVDAELVTQRHDDPGTACPSPAPPLRAHSPLPDASSGVSDYRRRRKVEVVPAGAMSTTAPCPPGAAQFRALTTAESAILTPAIDQAVAWINAALGELTAGDPEGDAALNTYFGGTGLRGIVRGNLVSWRDHLDTVVRVNNRHGTQCNAPCRTAIAFNQGSGAAAQMTVCPRFFRPLSIHGALSQAQNEAFVMLHEAGHGSIRTRDTGYGHRRLIEFLAGFPAVAVENTDSYTLLVLCLNGFTGFCSAPVTSETNVGMSAAEGVESRRGLAWLQTWLTWAEQDTSSLYGQMNTARESGRGVRAVNGYYADVYDELVSAFNIRRPAGDPPPTLGEQTRVAAILDRVSVMEDAAAAGLTVEKDASSAAVDRWAHGPGRSVFLTGGYFALTTDRARVEYLLPLIIRANPRITLALEPMYETYIKENVINNRDDNP